MLCTLDAPSTPYSWIRKIETMPDPVIDPAAPPVVPPVVPPAPAAWHAGLEGEALGHVQNKGWAAMSPADAAKAAAQAHREAERLIGVPADQVLRLPKETTDEAGWSTVWGRLGKPADKADYDLSTVKFADGSAPADAFLDFARTTAHSLNLSKDAAPRLAAEMVKFLDAAGTETAAVSTAALATEKAALATEWGPNQEANLFIAKQAAAKLGVDAAAVTALESVVGYAAVMKMFQKVGTAIGEAKFISSDGPTGGGILTVEQAQAKMAALRADTDWGKRYFAGGQAERREMDALSVILAGASVG